MDGFSPDEQARMLYLGLLYLALLAGLFTAYRDRLGAAVQHAAIWVLIFAGGVIAYGFKDQLTAQLVPGHAAVSGDTVRLTRAADGHFHARLEVNGAPIEFLVDTGATEMVLTLADAEAAGFDPQRLAFTQRAMTANGAVAGAPVRLERVEFAGITERNVPAVVNGGALHVSLLGMRYLDRFSGFEISGDTLTLRR
ncbi:MAG: TIGR02281 family clan AA aspartic protease [Pseudomonadota bacterium]